MNDETTGGEDRQEGVAGPERLIASLPYNVRSKPIEPFFIDLAPECFRQIPGYESDRAE